MGLGLGADGLVWGQMEFSWCVQARLNALLPHIFPLPPPEPPQQLPQLQPNMTPGSNLVRFHLRPQRPQPLDAGDDLLPALLEPAD